MTDTSERAAVPLLSEEDVFQRYERAVAALGEANPPSECELLDLLLLRDRIEQAVADELPPGSLDAIIRADRSLSDASTWLASGRRRLPFEDWRRALGPRADSWWWRLDELDLRITAVSPISLAIAGALLAMSLTLMTDMAVRLLSGGVDFVGLAGTIMQGFLALLAGGALTVSGRQWFGRLLQRRRVPRGSYGAWIVTISALVLLLAVAGWWSLRYVSLYYNNRGARLLLEGDIPGAMESYSRSLRAHPGNATVHYNLAAAKERIHDQGGAAEHYRAAIAHDNRMAGAYNNLARLHILEGRPFVAIDLLQQGLARHRHDPDDSFAFHKNLAWAYLESGLHLQARRELRIAGGIRDGASTHCLLAQLIEKESPGADTSAEWQQCLAHAADTSGAPETAWLALARERLLGGER